MSCPWTSVDPTKESVSMLEVTSEETAESLPKREMDELTNSAVVNMESLNEYEVHHFNDTDSDEVIAHLLQAQFSEDYNLMLKRTEEKYNRDSKVNISLSNYRTYCHDDDQGQTSINKTEKDLDPFVTIEKEYASIPRCGYKRIGDSSQIITKHDILMSSRINACRVLQFPPGIHTGDTAGSDVKLNNKVYNSLRAHSHAQFSRNKAKIKSRSK